MKTSALACLLSITLLAGAAPAAESTLPARLAEHRALVTRHAAGAVLVKIRFQQGDVAKEDGPLISYVCPNCSGVHYHDWTGFLDMDRPLELPGYVVAPDRVMIPDLRIRANVIASIAVSCAGEEVGAEMFRRYPEQEALELKTAKPLTAAKPYAFKSGEAKQFFYTTHEDGLTFSGVLPLSGLRVRHIANLAQDMIKLPGASVVLDGAGSPITLNFRGEMPCDEVSFACPSTWKGEAPQAFEQRLDALRRQLAASLVPVYIHREAEKGGGRSSRITFGDEDSDKTDLDTFGIAFPHGDLLVPLGFSASQIAAIDKMEATLPDGKRVPLEFVGATDRYALVVLRFADGKLPEGVRAMPFRKGSCADLYAKTFCPVGVRAFDGKVELSVRTCIVKGMSAVRGGEYVPDIPSSIMLEEHGGRTFAVTMAGEFLFGRFDKRAGERWSRGVSITANTLTQLVEKRAFNPEYALRKGKDRIRVAWIGVETQPLTQELAREKKVLGHLQQNDTRGVLVSSVHAASPAAQAGLRAGDVLLYVRRAGESKRTRFEDRSSSGASLFELSELFDRIDDAHLGMIDADRATPWPNVEEGINETFTTFGIGADVVIAYVRDGEKKEAALKLAQAPTHFRSAKRLKSKSIGAVFADLTFEVRGFFKLADDAPGIVVCKVQPGNPAAVAGLRPYEIVTHVDDKPVKSLKDFSDLVRDKKSFTLSVRRIEKTRVVRINLGDKSASGK